ncbi:MAG: hypothetical protein PHX46_04090 [Bacilli bacterium]|nr:hypothetical protein [Bacilli bacterium]
MKIKKLLKPLIILFVALIVFVSSTYAWLTEIQQANISEFVVEVGSYKMNSAFYYGEDYNNDGIISDSEYTLINESINFGVSNSSYIKPGDILHFKLEMENLTSYENILLYLYFRDADLEYSINNNKSLKDYIKIEYVEDGNENFVDKGTIQNILDNSNGYVFDDISVSRNETSKVYFNFIVIGETPNDLQTLFLTINELTLGFAQQI